MAVNIKVSSIIASLDAKVLSKPNCIAQYGKNRVFEVLIGVKRTSGVVDEMLLNYSSELKVFLKKGMFIHIDGDLRTLNKKGLSVVVKSLVFATDITILDEEPDYYQNDVKIDNAYLETLKEVRKSYADSNQDVAVYTIKVVRPHSRYSYLRCSSWGSDAIYLGNVGKKGMSLNVKARVQSHRTKTGVLHVSLAVYHVDSDSEGKS